MSEKLYNLLTTSDNEMSSSSKHILEESGPFCWTYITALMKNTFF